MRKAWVQRLLEASTNDVALATVQKVWRAGPRRLFDLVDAGESAEWLPPPAGLAEDVGRFPVGSQRGPR
jgi:hypothetical protein